MVIDERELLTKIQNGDKDAFRELYDRYIDGALRVATAVTKSKHSAADAVQETFIRIYNNINSFDGNRPFSPWFYRILINECRRFFSKKESSIDPVDYLDNTINHSYNETYSFEEYQELYNSITDLDEIYKISIILKYLRGFAEKDIAEILDININTVKSRLFKGRQKLKNQLEKKEKGGDL